MMGMTLGGAWATRGVRDVVDRLNVECSANGANLTWNGAMDAMSTGYRTMITVAALCAAVAMGSIEARAQVEEMPATPTVLTQNGIRYVSGGIGEEEAAAMQKMAAQYSLRLMVAHKSGEYLSDVDVTIASSTGKGVFSARTDGPFLLVALPPGHYRVTAASGQASQTRSVVVPARGTARLDMHLDPKQ